MITVKMLSIPDVLLIEPEVYGDNRGFFYESFNQNEFNQAIGRNVSFVQDNHSKSYQGVLRGLHYQSYPAEQGKLVRVVSGEIWDIAVDIRQHSDTYGNWVAQILSDENKKQLWIPEGFAHGFYVLSQFAEVIYKVNTPYSKENERTIHWKENKFNIEWPLINGKAILSPKDENGQKFGK